MTATFDIAAFDLLRFDTGRCPADAGALQAPTLSTQTWLPPRALRTNSEKALRSVRSASAQRWAAPTEEDPPSRQRVATGSVRSVRLGRAAFLQAEIPEDAERHG